MKTKILPMMDMSLPLCPLCSLPLREESSLDPFTGEVLLFKFSCTGPVCYYFTFLSIDSAFNKDSLRHLLDHEEIAELPKR